MVPIKDLGSIGLITDILAYRLPPNAWTDVRNVRFFNGELYSTLGHVRIMGAPEIPPYQIFSTVSAAGGTRIWAYGGPTKMYATDGSLHQEITRSVGGNYTGNEDDRWHGSPFGGIFLFNNGVDDPQAWIGPELATVLVKLPNWPATTSAKLVRPFGRFIVAYDVTKGATRYKYLVKWSDLADPGTVPASWDETDARTLAGENVLNETDGEIIEAKTLGQTNYIYKSDSVIRMEFIGGAYVFDFKEAFGDFGILSRDCVAEFKRKHVVAGREDVFMHDGVGYEPLLAGKMKRFYAGRLSSTKAHRSYVAMNYAENETWVCFAEEGSEWPNLAIIINMDTGVPTIRELQQISHMTFSPPPSPSGTSFDSISTPFDSMVGYFDQAISGAVKKQIIGVSPTNTPWNPDIGSIYLFDSGITFDGSPIIAYAERVQIGVMGVSRDGVPVSDFTRMKLVKELWPKIFLPNGGTLKIRIGSQEKPDKPVTWYDFVYGPNDLTVEPAIDARLWAIRLESDVAGDPWSLNEYDVDVSIISV